MYDIEEIRSKIRPIAIKYGLKSISLFGSYAKGLATEESDLDFVMDKGKLHGLIQYVHLIRELEE